MGIMSSEKIFIDPKEEINFVIDRALRSERERLIFVIPQNSIVLSSPVSINILFRELAKTKKLPLIVTEDEFGSMLATKAGFIVVPKVSQIMAEDWEKALSKKLKFLDGVEKRKNELLSNIGLIDNNPSNEESIQENKVVRKEDDEEFTDLSEVEEGEAVPAPIDISELPQMEENTLPTPVDEELVASAPEQISDEQKVSANEDEALKFYKKPRKESKVVEIGGIRVAAAGDIRAFLKEEEDDKISVAQNLDKNMEDIPERKIKRVVGSSSFAGKDFTKQVGGSKAGTFFGNLFNKNKVVSNNIDSNLKTRERRKKILVVSLVVGIFLLLGGGYLFAFQLSSVDVTISFKKEDVSASASVLLNPDVTEVSYDPAIIPARILREENLSLSKAGEASGEGKRGVKAKGFVTIYNLTDKAIVLAVGTKLTNTATQKVYLLQKEVSLEAGTPSAAFFEDDVPVEAFDFGSDFNIPISAESTSLEIEGYSPEFSSKKVYARVFNEIAGGSSETFVSVSQENIDALKEKILPELIAQGESRIRISLPSGYTLVSDTIEFTENEVSSVPKLGEESDEGNFSLSISGVVTAYAVSNEDLRLVAQRFLSENQGGINDEDDGSDLIFDQLELPQIVSVEQVEDSVTITISTEASVGLRPTDEVIKNGVAGKTINDALNYLQSVESIESSRINFTPGFIPESLRIVPSDQSRISIRTR